MNHSFNVKVAEEVGVLEATVFNSIGFWVDNARANNRGEHGGKHWTYNTIKAWAQQFPYASYKQIERALDKLRKAGLIEAKNLNKNQHDRTLWYTLSERGESLFYGAPIPENVSSISQNREMETHDSGNVINSTDTNPDANPITESKAQKRKRFTPPTPEEVRAYAEESGLDINADDFCDYWESVGWMRGKSKMKDWKATARQWARREQRFNAPKRRNEVKWDDDLRELADALDF